MTKINFLTAWTIASLFLTGIDAFHWPCEVSSDCTADGATCNTATAHCECSDWEAVFSSDYTKCLKTSLIGDQCEESVQCNHMPSGAKCKSGVCDCADGESYMRGRCRPLNGLNQYCDSDLDCYFGYDRDSVQCQNKICTCANGYYHRHGNICRRKSMGIGDVCVVATDCEDLGANAKCVNLKCQYVDEISADNSATNLRGLSNNNNNNSNSNNNNINNNTNNSSNNTNNNVKNTTATERQTSTTTSETLSNLSKSSPTDSILDNRPQLVNGDSITSSGTSSSSTNNNYDISPNSFNNNNKNNISNNNNAFSSDSDFENIISKPNSIQVSADLTTPQTDKATTTQSFKPVQKLREIAVQTSLETFELKYLPPKKKNVGTITTASTSSSSRRPSKQRRRSSLFRFEDDEKTFSTVSNTDDDNENRVYGASCTNNGKSCSGLPHSICSNSVCLCKQGYYARNGKCFAELGEIAESSDECENEFDDVSKKCICQKNYFYERSLRECRKPVQYRLSCTSNSQCSPFGAAFCHPDIPRRCTCEEYAEYDALLEMCVYKKGLGSECETNDACPIDNSMCSNRYCVCKEHFIQSKDQCVPGVGADCVEDAECSNVVNSKCEATRTSSVAEEDSKSCQCRKGFVHFKDECLKEAEEIEDECEDTEQCKPLLATCVNKKCSCTDEQHLQNGRCEVKKGLGEACTKASQCFVEKEPENVECRNSVCQCKVGHQSDVEQKICYRVAPSKKNSSGRPSALKIITFMLIGSAFLITSAAIKQAYY